MMPFTRARTEEQKAQRIAEIIDATAHLYLSRGFEEITFVSIAREAGFTRSNLYKYFNSKEEIFLEFLKHDILFWRQDLIDAFQTGRSYTVEAFAAVWVRVLSEHQRLLDLISILYSDLEKNASMENMIGFKRMAKKEYQVLSELLCKLFPALNPEKAARFLNMQLAASIGLYTMTNLSENQRKILDMPEFAPFNIDWKEYFKESVAYILKGLLA